MSYWKQSAPAVWDWSAIRSRWEPAFGRPAQPAFIQVSTELATESERYDFWRHVAYYHFEAAPRPRGAAFQANATGMVSEPAELFLYQSDAIDCIRTARQAQHDGGDCLSIGIVLAGERRAEEAGGRTARAMPGMPFVFDAAQPARIGWTRHRALHLMIRRPEVVSALGGEIPPANRLADGLRITGIFGLLREHLIAVARSMARLDADGRALALDNVCRLARYALVQAMQAPLDGRPVPPDLYIAALAVIERHLAHPSLDPEMLARVLGCSRATLYRAFRQQGQGVAETIHDMRFRAARHRLETAEPTASISEIAVSCGILDTVNFSRRFRERYGMSPSEAHSARRAITIGPLARP